MLLYLRDSLKNNYQTSHSSLMGEETKRYAVVTGANKGIGYGICKKLASSGIVVVLTARNEERGLEAVERLKEHFGVSNLLLFHQLDVDDPASISSLAHFIKSQFGKLDILVNNAGLSGGKLVDGNALLRKRNGEEIDWNEVGYQTYELAEKCLETNFYGVERVTEALLPLLQLSTSPRIVNISSRAGLLKNISNDWARTVFSDIENLTREKIDSVLQEFQKDYKEGSLEIKGWPTFASAYTISKAALNAYTRMMAKKYPHFHINSVCPGFVKTDMTSNTGKLSIEEGAETPVMLALLPKSGLSGCFFNQDEKVEEVLNEFHKDFKEGLLETKGWPPFSSAYIVSKAALNAYTRILANKYTYLCINAVCPGYVKTDLNYNTGHLSVDKGAESVLKLALLPNGAPSGLFFFRSEVAPF